LDNSQPFTPQSSSQGPRQEKTVENLPPGKSDGLRVIREYKKETFTDVSGLSGFRAFSPP
jgi:hypothetical protein